MNSVRGFVCRECRRTLHPVRQRQAPLRSLATASNVQPLRLGIIGSGPAGFYAALRVMQKLPDARVDMYERLPVPFGLVRYGVAPDHPEVKNCQDRFEEVAQSDRFTFIGNTTIGRDVRLGTMKQHYDALLFAYGASEDRPLGIEGEDLKGVHSAREFVGWYNGLPEFAYSQPDLDNENAVVIGNGNVALDVARILLTDVDVLRDTDISDAALEHLSKSRVRSVTIAGRRGPRQASFTIKEARELVTLPDTAFKMTNPDLLPTTEYVKSLPKLEQRQYRMVQLLKDSVREEGAKECTLLSMASPTAFKGHNGSLSSTTFMATSFEHQEQRFDPSARVKLDEAAADFSIPARLAFRSIGYRSLPLPDMDTALNIDFEANKGIIQNDGLGRALSLKNLIEGAEKPVAKDILFGCYCSGWVKTGPTGVIASTMNDAFTTADAIVADWESDVEFLNGRRSERAAAHTGGWDSLKYETGDFGAVSWAQWHAIDTFEKSRAGERRPRSKLLTVDEMLAVANQ